MQSFAVFFGVSQNKPLNQQMRSQWFMMPSSICDPHNIGPCYDSTKLYELKETSKATIKINLEKFFVSSVICHNAAQDHSTYGSQIADTLSLVISKLCFLF